MARRSGGSRACIHNAHVARAYSIIGPGTQYDALNEIQDGLYSDGGIFVFLGIGRAQQAREVVKTSTKGSRVRVN